MRKLLLVPILLSLPLLLGHAQTLDQAGADTEITCPSPSATLWTVEQVGNRWTFCEPTSLGSHAFRPHGINDAGIFDTGAKLGNIDVPASACFGSGSPTTACTGSGTCVAGACLGRYFNNLPLNTDVVAGVRGTGTAWNYNWSEIQLQRMINWGFNNLSDGPLAILVPMHKDNNWNTGDITLPAKYRRTVIGYATVVVYMYANNNGCGLASAIKDITISTNSTVNGGLGYTSDWPDTLDPHYATCLNGIVGTTVAAAGGVYDPAGPNVNYLIAFVMDEEGQVFFLTQGPDFQKIQGSTLNANYGQDPQAGWYVLATDPLLTNNASQHAAATDHENYSKVRMADWLATKYAQADCTGAGTPFTSCTGIGTAANGSVDPSCTGTLPSYCGGNTFITSTEMTAAKNALNTAWGSSFTTLSTSSANCTSNLAECLIGNGPCTASATPYSWCTGSGTGNAVAYASYGTGTGLLDANGTAAFIGDACTLGANTDVNKCGNPGVGSTYSAETSAMKTDLQNFAANVYINAYFSTMAAAYHTSYGANFPLGMEVGGYACPPQHSVLQAMKNNNIIPAFTFPNHCTNCSGGDLQSRVDFIYTWMGNQPFWSDLFFEATPESAAAWAGPNSAGTYATTQAQKGQFFAGDIQSTADIAYTANGVHPDLGYTVWEMFDMESQKLNWGEVSPNDNPYDGKCATSLFYRDNFGLTCGESMMSVLTCSASTNPLSECSGNAAGTVPAIPPIVYACTASTNPYPSCTGSKTGTGTINYGDELDYVISANFGDYRRAFPVVAHAGIGIGMQ